MKTLDSPNYFKKDVTILNTNSALISNIDGMEFQVESYKQDFKRIMEKKFPQYNIELEIVDDNITNIIFAEAKGDITELEKSELIDAVYADDLISLHAEPRYYIQKTNFNKDNYCEENNFKKYHHKDDSECIIYGRYNLSKFKERELTSVELYFLKYISTIKSNPLKNISGDWTYDYHLNYQEVLNRFVGQGLVRVEELTLNEKVNYIYKVDELRKILKTKGLKVGGKKSILVKRIIENLDEDELHDYIKQRYIRYKLTEKGKLIIEDINPSITRNMELEDTSYNLILNNSIEEAYKIISDFKKQKAFSGLSISIGISENTEFGREIDYVNVSKYNTLINTDLGLPKSLINKQKNIISCIIVGDMLGCRSCEITRLVKRLVNTGLDDTQINKYVDYGLSLIKRAKYIK